MEFSKRHMPWAVVVTSILLLIGGYQYLFAPPSPFPSGDIVTVIRGTSVSEITQKLATARIIEHPTLLKLILRISGKSDSVQTGAYKFATPQNVFIIARRLINGDYGLPPMRITFIEGVTNESAAKQVTQALPEISEQDFLMLAKPYAGYLFPDTYILQPSATAESIVAMMRSNFDTKMAPLLNVPDASKHSLSDIVSMASIIEREASSTVDRHVISGILWNRIELNMPLQVDVARETYTHTGFTSKPICNPGLDSLEAAMNPTKTKYLYYLTGHDGLMHYATTYAGHQVNLRRYLY
ncbi:MAG: endolytic transglycosylase MltG [Minisyncoccia bacterium]